MACILSQPGRHIPGILHHEEWMMWTVHTISYNNWCMTKVMAKCTREWRDASRHDNYQGWHVILIWMKVQRHCVIRRDIFGDVHSYVICGVCLPPWRQAEHILVNDAPLWCVPSNLQIVEWEKFRNIFQMDYSKPGAVKKTSEFLTISIS